MRSALAAVLGAAALTAAVTAASWRLSLAVP
ncbi:MAG: hypothetical protein JWL78_263, partial [Chloroflexi bacterium]|nr:hypothetical protein [Chloroflexota bacterium]